MKRRVTIIIVFLLLGAVVNVAVAWGCVLTSRTLKMNHLVVNETDSPLGVAKGAILFEGRGYSTLRVDYGYSLPFTAERMMWHDRAGAPLYSMSGQYLDLYSDSGGRLIGSAQLPFSIRDPSPYEIFAPERLPLRPIWPGFAINTLFYAILVWLLIFIPFAARRTLRRRRGLCAKCAYPVGISHVCTECGAAVREDQPRGD